jgi:hypothetical protein
VRSPRLARLARRSTPLPETSADRTAEPQEEACELCGEWLPERHRHLVDVPAGRLLCTCQACSTLLDHSAAGGSHYRLVPRETRRVVDPDVPDPRWHALAVPVELAFVLHSTPEDGLVALYPGAMGATAARPDPDAWRVIVEENPVFAGLEPDVEAVLFRRTRPAEGPSGEGVREAWITPIDLCFQLTGRIRSRWRGLSGGSEVWEALDEFFDRLAGEAIPVDRHGRRAHSASASASASETRSTHEEASP